MPFYVGDYLRDTMHLTPVEHGTYLLLICSAWTTQGRLKNDDKLLASIAKASDEEWVKLKVVMSKFFKRTPHWWVHKRVDSELKKAAHIHQVREKAGKKGSANRWQKLNSRARDSTATTTTTVAPPINDPPPIGAADERRRPRRLPADWKPDPADCEFAGQLGLDPEEVAAEFRDYWSALPSGRRATRLDWHATFRNACRLYASRYRGGNGVGRTGKHRQAGASFTAAIRRAFAEARDEGMA